MKTLAALSRGRNNNFNLLRFLAAVLVIWSHSFALALGSGDSEPLRSTLGVTFGSIAVDVFFVTSGYLISASLVSSKTIFRFAWARILRIFPGLIVATLITVVFVALFITSESVAQYFSERSTWKFLIKNSVLVRGVEYGLPGAFVNNAIPYAVNGSLWTLPKELLMYALLAMVWLIAGAMSQMRLGGRERIFKVLVSITFLGSALFYFLVLKEYVEDSNARLLTAFCFGACMSLSRDRLPVDGRLVIAMGVAILLATAHKQLFFFVYTLFFPYVVICSALWQSRQLQGFNRVGDYSYGLYVYAFPVQQVIVSFFTGIQPIGLFALSLLASLALAVVSWHFVEKPALSMKNVRLPLRYSSSEA